MAKICENPKCNESLEGRTSKARFCSDNCRAHYHNIKGKKNNEMGLPKAFSGFNPQQDNSGSTFLLTARINELMDEKKKLNEKIDKQQDKIDKLNDKLKDKEMELIKNEKPTGLGGLDSDLLGTIIGALSPTINAFGEKMANGAGSSKSLLEGLDIKKQQMITKFAAIMAQLPEEQSEHLWAIVQEAAKGNIDTATQLINNYKNKYSHGTKAING